MSPYETLSLLVSVIAIGISFTALYRSRKVSEKQLELEAATAELSKKQLKIIEKDEANSAKAQIDAEFVRVGNEYRFIVRNVGLAVANNISFGFEGYGYPLIAEDYASKHPISELRPGKYVEFFTNIDMSSANEYAFSFLWHNPDGSQDKDNFVCRL